MDTPDFFVGARLGGARVKAGISLEKAAKDTRIRVQRLREIEADDFSGFTHPTYSRLFLLDYAEYLGIDAEEIRPLLPDRAGAAGGGFQYINMLTREPLSAAAVPMQHKRRVLLRIFVAFGLTFLLAAAGIFVYLTVKKIERVTGSTPLSETAVTEPPAASPAAIGEPQPPSPAESASVENALPAMPAPPAPRADGGGNSAPPPAP